MTYCGTFSDMTNTMLIPGTVLLSSREATKYALIID